MKQMPMLVGVVVAVFFFCQTSLVVHGAVPDCFFAFSAMSANELSGDVAEGSVAAVQAPKTLQPEALDTFPFRSGEQEAEMETHTVPEPATLILIGLAAITLILGRGWRK